VVWQSGCLLWFCLPYLSGTGPSPYQRERTLAQPMQPVAMGPGWCCREKTIQVFFPEGLSGLFWLLRPWQFI
jgi:hypothetical protein